MNRPSISEIEWSDLILHWRKIAGQVAMTPQFLHDVEAKIAQDAFSFAGERLLLQMQSRVLAEKVDHEDQTVTFTRTVTPPPIEIEVRRDRSLLVPLAGGILIVGLLLAFTTATQAAYFGLVAMLALVVGIATEGSTTRTIEPPDVTISGEVTIGADYFHTFPHNETVYPKSLGASVRMIEYTAPDFRFFDPDAARAARAKKREEN